MIYIQVENEVVVFRHFMPFDERLGLGKPREELELEGFFVDEIPEPNNDDTKTSILKWDGKNLYYEYVESPLTEGEELESIKNENAELLLQNAVQDLSISQLQDENAELILKIAMLEVKVNV